MVAKCSLKEVESQGTRIEAVQVALENHLHPIACQVVIDGSDRGDLLPLAGADYRFGWCSEQWGEPSAIAAALQSEPFFRNNGSVTHLVVMGQFESDPLAWPDQSCT